MENLLELSNNGTPQDGGQCCSQAGRYPSGWRRMLVRLLCVVGSRVVRVAVVLLCSRAFLGHAATEYPVLDTRYCYAHARHAGESRMGSISTAMADSAGCDVEAIRTSIWAGDPETGRGLLRFQYTFGGTSSEEFAGVFFSFGRMAVDTVRPDGTAGPPIDLHGDGTLDFDHLVRCGVAESTIEAIRLRLRRVDPATDLVVRAELEDADGRKAYVRFRFAPVSDATVTVTLARSLFSAGLDWSRVKKFSIIIEETHVVDGVHNARAGVFDIESIHLVDEDGTGQSAAEITGLTDREFVRMLARGDFETLRSLYDPVSGASLDRTLSRALLHWGATGWVLAALPLAVEQGWITVDEARARALLILRFVDRDSVWGDAPVGMLGNSRGVMYRFGGIDAAGLDGPLTGTRKIDLGNINAVEASIIDTALFDMGAATCAAGFQEDHPDEVEIRSRAAAILARRHWDELVDPASGQLFMAWKPELDDAGGYRTPAAFGGFWASRGATDELPLTIDWWTAEGAMAALLAVGSDSHPVDASVWYAMFRQNRGGTVLTWPGAWFTYAFLASTYFDPDLGADRGGDYGVPAVDWHANTVAAYDTYRTLVAAAPALPDAVELPDTTYEAQGLPALSVGLSRFTGTRTPYSLQMATGLGGATASSAIEALRRIVTDRPDIWDPRFGLLDSYHLDLAQFPGADALARAAGPWTQNQKWPLNAGAALIAQLNYLTDGGVWRASATAPVLARAVQRIYREAHVAAHTTVVLPIPGGNDAWGCAVSRELILFTDSDQEALHFYSATGTYLGATSYAAIGNTLAAHGIVVERSGGPAGVRDAAALPDGSFVVLVAGPGTDTLLRVWRDRSVQVLAHEFGEAMTRGDEIGNYPRVTVGGTPPRILVTVNSPVRGIAVLGLDGTLLHTLALAGQCHGLAVEPRSNRLFLLRHDGVVEQYDDLTVTGLSPLALASLPTGVLGRDLAYSVACWTSGGPSLLAVGSDGRLYRVSPAGGEMIAIVDDCLTGVAAVDVAGPEMAIARDESGAYQRFAVPYFEAYTLTVDGGTGGGEIVPGNTVQITAGRGPVGLSFASWTFEPKGLDLGSAFDPLAQTTAVTMPACNLTLTPTYGYGHCAYPLVDGYATVGMPMEGHAIDSAAALLAAIPNATEVWRWDAASQAWQGHIGGTTEDFAVVPGAAYVVQCTAPGTWTIEGIWATGVQVQMVPSYALFCLSADADTITCASALLATVPQATGIWRWDAEGQRWSGYLALFGGDDFPLAPGAVVLVSTSEGGTWPQP